MINTGDKLTCMDGNDFFIKGQVYTVGNILNANFFEINTGNDGGFWYATGDTDSIYVHFDSTKNKMNDARFTKI